MSFRCGDCENFDDKKNECKILRNKDIDMLTQANYYCDGDFDLGMEE